MFQRDHRPEAREWTSRTLAAIAAKDAVLAGQVPADIAAWCPGYATNSLPERRAFWAAGVTSADTMLLPEGRPAGQAWLFPAAAADALSALDPREVFTVEFLFRDGSIARSTFEAGDFAAGRAFLAMGQV